LAAIPRFARAKVVLPQAVTQPQLDLCPQWLSQETLKVEDSADRGWSAVSMQ
jgi:hypothetical protein